MEKDIKKWKGAVQDDQNVHKSSLVWFPAEKVMSIDLIRRKLFLEFLSAPDLLTCRLVCKRWTEDASSALLLPKFVRSLRVSFYYTTTGPKPHNYVNETTGRTLRDWLQSRPFFHNLTFPCTNFQFQNGSLETNEDSLRFFMDIKSESEPKTESASESHRICSLLLAVWFCGYETQVAPLLQLLRPHVTHLKYLTLKHIHPKSCTDPESPWYCPPRGPTDLNRFQGPGVEEMELKLGPVQFTALEEFRDVLENEGLGLELVRSVLKRAPNLKWVIHPRSGNLKAVWLEGKVRTVHSWFFIPRAVEENAPYWTDKPETCIFLEEQPTLKEFGIELQRLGRPLSSQELQCVSLVLKKSQRSLERIWDILDLLQCSKRMGLEIPRLENVTTVTQQRPPLSIPGEWFSNQNPGQGQGQGQGPCPGQQVNTNRQDVEMDRDFLSRVCPNVQHVVINDWRPWGGWAVRDFAYPFAFDLCDPLPSVSKVSVHFGLSCSISALAHREIASIIRLCPNLTVIQLFFPGPRPVTFPQLFGRIIQHFKKVRTLAFHFRDSINHIKVKEDIDDGDPFVWMSKLDSVVCGFSPETCKTLALQLQLTKEADSSGFQNTNLDLHNEKVSSSILDLKDLICLRFKFDPKILRQSLPPFFSPVAFLYGFDILARRQYFYLEFPKQFINPTI